MERALAVATILLHMPPRASIGALVLDVVFVTWLWRSLREAEAAGLDGPVAVRRAVASGTLEDAESVAKVVDRRSGGRSSPAVAIARIVG